MREAVDACRNVGIPSIGLWRHKVSETGIETPAHLVREVGLSVSGLCRGGMFPAATASERRTRIEDNLRAADEAAALGAPVLVLVCGAAPDRDIAGARAMIEDGIAAILPYGEERRIMLGIEPLHPMFAAERSAIVTLSQALGIAERLASPWVGAVIDTYHVWWDPELYTQISRAAGRIAGFHLNDWIEPLGDRLHGRGMMGDGVIDLARIARAVDDAGYCGPIEVEIFNRTIWDMPVDQVLARIKQRYLALASPSPAV